MFSIIFAVATPALARRSGGFGGGFTKPKTTSPKTTQSSPDKTDSSSTSGDKIPYTNLPSGKKTTTGGSTITAPMVGRSNFSGFSFSPFSGNFWMWMFLMNSFGHSQPAVAQTGENSTNPEAQVKGAEDQSPIYTPGVKDYWAADPVTNTLSTLLLLAVVALPIWLLLRWKKKMTALR